MSEYRLTRRGKVVLFLFIALLIYACSSGLIFISSLFKQSENISREPGQTHIVIESSEEALATQTTAAIDTSSPSLVSSDEKKILKKSACSVYFNPSESNLEDQLMLEDLDDFIAVALDFPNEEITIVGFSLLTPSEENSEDENKRALEVAKKRAEGVKNYLVDASILPGQIIINYDTITSNAFPEEEKWRGFRVDIYFSRFNPYEVK